MRLCLLLLILNLAALHAQAQTSPAPSREERREADARELGKALEYFSAAKYHEALLILDKLDSLYTLNPRYRAYLGVCHYYEWNYGQAIRYLEESLPHLDNFSPAERSFYYWADAESHFRLGHYKEAVPLYRKMLTLCHEDEKPDAYYRLGFCYVFEENWAEALRHMRLSLKYYRQLRDTPDLKARITQITNMIRGCEEKVGKQADSIPLHAPKPGYKEGHHLGNP